jgi:hypothetical protein
MLVKKAGKKERKENIKAQKRSSSGDAGKKKAKIKEKIKAQKALVVMGPSAAK